MRKFFLSCVVLLAIVVSGPRLAAMADPNPGDEEMTELGEHMDRMSGAFRKLRRQAGDPAHNAASLELLGEMRAAAQAAGKLIPAKAADLPESEREKFTAAYRKRMGQLLAQLADIEASLKAGDNPAAQKQIGELADFQKASHREYRKTKP
jgi:soluble cytochrome b562